MLVGVLAEVCGVGSSAREMREARMFRTSSLRKCHRAGIQRRQGVGRGRSRRARGQADGFYQVAGEGGRLATGGERPASDQVDPRHAGFTIESPAALSRNIARGIEVVRKMDKSTATVHEKVRLRRLRHAFGLE